MHGWQHFRKPQKSLNLRKFEADEHEHLTCYCWAGGTNIPVTVLSILTLPFFLR